MKKGLESVPEKYRDRTWYSCEVAGVYTFLVDGPITFGHSQLVISNKSMKKEDEIFEKASLHVVMCIKVLQNMLIEISKSNFRPWRELASYTETFGKYKKTLIFRASANETAREYKIHLIPYFKSHVEATKRLYTAEFKSGVGGLLHWVGQRELLVDYDMRYGRDDKTAQERITSFKLQSLAAMLHSEWSKTFRGQGR
jgi:hypothetical protein